MRATLHARLINGRFGDPAMIVRLQHRRECLLFDAGDLSALNSHDLLRVSHVFISHMHVDHFIGFDRLIRVQIGRSKTIRIIVPPSGSQRVGHKLQAYDWDLASRYSDDVIFEVVEVGAAGPVGAERYSFRNSFAPEPLKIPADWSDIAGLRLETALLQHHGKCLGFAISEAAHVNVWKERLTKRGLRPGKWLQRLKVAIVEDAPPETLISLGERDHRPLSDLRDLVTISRGQKIAYVTDVADNPSNRRAIADLAQSADILFLEARFTAEDREIADERAHLTTAATGTIARQAGVKRIEPFHFSPRYQADEQRMMSEVAAAFEPPAHADV